MLQKRNKELYEEFKGSSIVRDGIENDAFVLLVYEILYKEKIDFDLTSKNLKILCKSIVPPPDNGIDIFFESEEGDEFYYDIIQVKYSTLSEHEIKQCFSVMERTIKDYLKEPKSVNKNLRNIISSTNFDATYKNNCTYYVVHKGDINYSNSLNNNEKIITYTDLVTLSESLDKSCVPYEEIRADKFNNFILYGEDSNDSSNAEIKDAQAFLCNLNGYDLASLNNKYASTEIGKNILFGQNLRDSLEKKSKTYNAMKLTIDKEPEKFWYYNNGITIIAKEYDTPRKDKEVKDDTETIILKDFSIINGAQTTSALGFYLKEALMNKEIEKEEQLKKVYVLTRILVIEKDTDFRDSIAIYNNTQNPITSRDMVSNKDEQRRLHDWLISGEEPHIFVEIRRGTHSPIKVYPHQYTNNEILAQLAFASFYRNPFTAKDKKSTLFNNDYSQSEYTINEDYHKIFNYSKDESTMGILFKKTKEEINELLFIYHLYKEARKYMKKVFSSRIQELKEDIKKADENERDNLQSQINIYNKQIEINNICLFYNVSLYYEIKNQFKSKDYNKRFKYHDYYKNIDHYKDNLIEFYAKKYLGITIAIIRDKSEDTSNIGNWIKSSKSQEIYFKALRNDLAVKLEYESDFEKFIDAFKEEIK